MDAPPVDGLKFEYPLNTPAQAHEDSSLSLGLGVLGGMLYKSLVVDPGEESGYGLPSSLTMDFSPLQ